MMGLSRDTFYRYRDAVEEGGVEALLEKTRRVPNRKNRDDACNGECSVLKVGNIHASVHNHCNQDRHSNGRKAFKVYRLVALTEWRQLAV